MILALEGPDRCGKTTLWEALKPHFPDAAFVGRLPLPGVLMPVMAEVEARQACLWVQLYDPSRLYICDRHFSVSGPVYDAFYGRKTTVDWRRWVPEVTVMYLQTPVAELRRRIVGCGDDYCKAEDCGRLCELYLEHLQNFRCCFFASEEGRVEVAKGLIEACL